MHAYTKIVMYVKGESYRLSSLQGQQRHTDRLKSRTAWQACSKLPSLRLCVVCVYLNQYMYVCTHIHVHTQCAMRLDTYEPV